MTVTPRRVALAVAFIFVLITTRPLLTANPSSRCETPMIFEAFRAKAEVPSGSNTTGFGEFSTLVLQPRQQNTCIDQARDKMGATATRLAFFGGAVVVVALIFGWRPGRRYEDEVEDESDELVDSDELR